MVSQSLVAQNRYTLTWVDFMRLIGAFLVVLAHIELWGAGPSWATYFYATLSRIGVPIFFLISGSLLLSKQEELGVFFKKRAARILIPFLVWSIIYDIQNSHTFVDTGFTLAAVLKMFIRIVRGPRAAHLWFFYSLIGLYLITPILRVFVSRAGRSELFYFIALWFLAAPILYLVEGLTPLKNGFEIFYSGGYVGYFLLGYYLGKLEAKPPLLWSALGLFVIGFLFSFTVFYFNLPPQKNELVFRSYPSLNIVVMSLGAFVLIKAAGEKISMPWAHLSEQAGKVSLGIYLIHPIVFAWMALALNAFGLQTNSGNSVFVIPLAALVNFIFSWMIIALIRKIPLLRFVV